MGIYFGCYQLTSPWFLIVTIQTLAHLGSSWNLLYVLETSRAAGAVQDAGLTVGGATCRRAAGAWGGGAASVWVP